MDKVRACVDQIEPLFKALDKKDYDEVGEISREKHLGFTADPTCNYCPNRITSPCLSFNL